MSEPHDSAIALIRPKYYAHENFLAATGLTPRYGRSLAERWGILLWPNGGRRWVVDADEFDAALKSERKQSERQARSLSPEPIDSAEALRRELGLERRK